MKLSDQNAILFEFSDARSATLASDTLEELGYAPVSHENNRIHIHIEGSDLTSALEIAQANGGRLVEQSHIADWAVTDTAYALDAVTIPAHVVNEDWVDSYGAGQQEESYLLRNRDDDADYDDEFIPDPGTYDHFSGDVHT
ncbi:hypothetical protein [Paenibacillus harenae]|uniref:hypothetical protein n=1 Tax=Paenibacillus harenae TaxID=306543 RepID=UPI0027D9038D|nr:hypothetical protein [Paenibacillus harenae]